AARARVANLDTLHVADPGRPDTTVGERPGRGAHADRVRLGHRQVFNHQVGIIGPRDDDRHVADRFIVTLEDEFRNRIRMVGTDDDVERTADAVGQRDGRVRDQVMAAGNERARAREDRELQVVRAVERVGRKHHAVDPGYGPGGEIAEIVDPEADRGRITAFQPARRRRREAGYL